jgi:hypothetical protein
MERWAVMPDRVELDFSKEIVWKSLAMSAFPIWVAFVVTYVVHLFWYGSVTPWIESGRDF